jgi:hypothetical protein
MIVGPVYGYQGSKIVQTGTRAINPRRVWEKRVREALEAKLGRPLTKLERRVAKRLRPVSP